MPRLAGAEGGGRRLRGQAFTLPRKPSQMPSGTTTTQHIVTVPTAGRAGVSPPESLEPLGGSPQRQYAPALGWTWVNIGPQARRGSAHVCRPGQEPALPPAWGCRKAPTAWKPEWDQPGYRACGSKPAPPEEHSCCSCFWPSKRKATLRTHIVPGFPVPPLQGQLLAGPVHVPVPS